MSINISNCIDLDHGCLLNSFSFANIVSCLFQRFFNEWCVRA